MKDVFIAYGVIAWIVNIFLCAWLAGQKHRSSGVWILLGILFPGLAIIAIAGATIEQPVPFPRYIVNEAENKIDNKPTNLSLMGTKCPICGRECETNESLKTHMQVLHPDVTS
jgi:hypothetical protein